MITDNDRQRIEQEAKRFTEGWGENCDIKSFKAGAEYATIYERERQQLPPDNETVEDGGGCYVAGSREDFQKAMDGPYVDMSKPNIFMDGDNNSYSLMTSSDPEKREKGKQIRIHELTSRIKQLEAERSKLRNKVIEECIAKVTDRYGERISKATLIELLNSLKTK